jgi:basic amino acid/polyamine antiporter, APA family
MFKDLLRKKSVASILAETELQNQKSGESHLNKTLKVRDLISFGIAAIVGAGIFSTIGKASADGGPAVIYLFLFTAMACSFTAYAYAEFASLVPVAGSAYTYSYIAFGEIIAWIIGWALILEYAVSNMVVAISWSSYFTGLMDTLHMHIPRWMTMDYLSAHKGYIEATKLLGSGTSLNHLSTALQDALEAWKFSPTLGGIHLVMNIPALVIVIFITALVYIGIKESRNASNVMVIIKLSVLILIIVIGVFYIHWDNYIPFVPRGAGGVLKGVSAVFFAYIGFDALSTTAEECVDPQKDLPRGMMWSIIISTVLYIAIALVLTGMVNFSLLGVGDPLAFAFKHIGWMSIIIAISSVIALSSALLVYQLGQPRIWMRMSKDGLLPKAFGKIHPKYKTPSFATIITGIVVAIPSLFLNLSIVTDITSVGTLFAFILVCAGVMKLQSDPNGPRGKFKTPYVNAKFVLPIILFAGLVFGYSFKKQAITDFLKNEPKIVESSELVLHLNDHDLKLVESKVREKDPIGFGKSEKNLNTYLTALPDDAYHHLLLSCGLPKKTIYNEGWNLFKQKIPSWIFIIALLTSLIFAFRNNLSLIPLLGFLSCLYMMSELALVNWIGFLIWLIFGLIVYFLYGYKNSLLTSDQKLVRMT